MGIPKSRMISESAVKWRRLIQRRREHLTALYQSGRYKKYFTEEQFLKQMREAALAAQEWDVFIAAHPALSVVESRREPQPGHPLEIRIGKAA